MHFAKGDRVRVDIPDRDDPDFERFHGEHGVGIAYLNNNVESEISVTI